MKKVFKIFPLVFLCLGLSSCLKDELYTVDTNKSPGIVEFSASPDISSDSEFIYPTYKKSFPFTSEVDYPITINYAGGKTAPADIVVDVQVDDAALIRYNAQIIAYARAEAISIDADPDEAEALAKVTKTYTQAPTSFYSIPSNTVTIKKGERTATFIVKVKSELIDFDNRYAIPLTITSASGSTISGNFSTGIFGIVAKNDYEAKYDVEITLTHPTVGGDYDDSDKGGTEFKTINANTVEAYLAVMELFAPVSKLYITVNPDNSLTLTSNAVTIVQTPGKNYYDPATKTFHFDYGWGTRWVVGTAVRQE